MASPDGPLLILRCALSTSREKAPSPPPPRTGPDFSHTAVIEFYTGYWVNWQLSCGPELRLFRALMAQERVLVRPTGVWPPRPVAPVRSPPHSTFASPRTVVRILP